MTSLFEKVINKYHYAIESIKNRYPCKIISTKNIDCFDKDTVIQYQAASRLNIRYSTTQELLNDPLLIEKFHPTDGVKLGFLACGEILLKEDMPLEKARELYLKIINQMFNDSKS